VPERRDAKLLEVLRRQTGQDRLVYLVLAEYCLVLPEAQAPQPDHDVHDGALNGLPLMIVRTSRRVQRSLRAAPPTRRKLGADPRPFTPLPARPPKAYHDRLVAMIQVWKSDRSSSTWARSCTPARQCAGVA
jgi:hypothetical protein